MHRVIENQAIDDFADSLKHKKQPPTHADLIKEERTRVFKESIKHKSPETIDLERDVEIERERARDRKRKQRLLEEYKEKEAVIENLIPSTVLPSKYHTFAWIVLATIIVVLIWNIAAYINNYINPEPTKQGVVDVVVTNAGFVANLFNTTPEIIAIVCFGVFFIAFVLMKLASAPTLYVFAMKMLVITSGTATVIVALKSKTRPPLWAKVSAIVIGIISTMLVGQMLDQMIGAHRDIMNKVGGYAYHARDFHGNIWKKIIAKFTFNTQEHDDLGAGLGAGLGADPVGTGVEDNTEFTDAHTRSSQGHH